MEPVHILIVLVLIYLLYLFMQGECCSVCGGGMNCPGCGKKCKSDKCKECDLKAVCPKCEQSFKGCNCRN